MRSQRPSNPVVRVALPVYGNRVLPRFCVARAFCLAETDPDAVAVGNVESRVWEPGDEPRLGRWLRDLGVEGVVCGGIHARHQVALEAEGLWVSRGHRGEIDTVMHQLLRGAKARRQALGPPARYRKDAAAGQDDRGRSRPQSPGQKSPRARKNKAYARSPKRCSKRKSNG